MLLAHIEGTLPQPYSIESAGRCHMYIPPGGQADVTSPASHSGLIAQNVCWPAKHICCKELITSISVALFLPDPKIFRARATEPTQWLYPWAVQSSHS